jgi:cobalt/nickel transport protein
MSIRADALGQITIGLPKAGWWGICALDLDGDELQHDGRPLSLDAVLWIKATEMQ